MDNKKFVKEQLVKLLYGLTFFLAIGLVAVGLDFLSIFVETLGVSSFTVGALSFTAHAMLVMDLVLFFCYIAIECIEQIKGMMK